MRPVSGFVIVCSKLARTVFTFVHAATARSSRSDCGTERGRLAAVVIVSAAANASTVGVNRVMDGLPLRHRRGSGHGRDRSPDCGGNGAGLTHQARELIRIE